MVWKPGHNSIAIHAWAEDRVVQDKSYGPNDHMSPQGPPVLKNKQMPYHFEEAEKFTARFTKWVYQDVQQGLSCMVGFLALDCKGEVYLPGEYKSGKQECQKPWNS